MRADVKNSKEGSKERRQARSAKEFHEKSVFGQKSSSVYKTCSQNKGVAMMLVMRLIK